MMEAMVAHVQNSVSQPVNDQLNTMPTWSSTMPTDESLNPVEEEEQVPEARAWATYQDNDTENVLSDNLARNQKSILSSALQAKRQKGKEDPRAVEQILSYIDRRRPPRQKKYRVTWRTFIGTMSGIDHVYAREDFLQYYTEFRPLVVFMDSVFRGIGQVMFANSSLSGIIISIGLFIGNWELALYGLLGTIVSTLTAHIFGFNMGAIRAGLYGYNGCLTAMGIAYFSFSRSPQLIGPVIVMSAFSTVFAMAIGKILVQRLEISPFTFSFQICSWIWLLGALRYSYFFINGNILSPHLLVTSIEKPQLSNVSVPHFTVEDNFIGFFASVAQVYFIENPYTGAIVLVGVCICSRILAFFALFGAVTAQLSAAYLLGLSPSAIRAGLWGFNSVLTCQALGGMFFVLYGYRIWLFTLYGSIMTVLLQAAVSAFLTPAGMPTFTFPFTVICWIFCLIAGSRNLIAVKLTAVSIPEDHCSRFRLALMVKTQFKFLNYLKYLSTNINEDITWEELSKIKEIFVPILLCTHVHANDLKAIQVLMKEGISSNISDQNCRTPLHLSASEGNLKITKWLVEKLKIDTNSVDKFGGTPLLDALWHGHFHLLPYLFSHGARLPVAKSKELAFYLNAFIYEGSWDAVQTLLACGFNPNASDYDGRNALHIAVMTNQFELVTYLVEEFSVWLNIKDYFGQTPFNYASTLSDLSIANFLKEKLDDDYKPPKKPEKKPSLLEIVVERVLEVRKLVEDQNEKKEIELNIDERLLTNVFCMLAGQGDVQIMNNFVKEFPDLNMFDCVDYDFRSAAHAAAAEGRLESIRFLSEQCKPTEFRRMMSREDRWGLSPLDEALRNGHLHISQFVNEYLSDHPEKESKNIDFSIQMDLDDNVTVRLLHKWRKTFLCCTLAASGAAERIDHLFQRGYFISKELYADYHSRTPMHFAAANGHLDVVEVLIQHGHDGVLVRDRWGNYPIDEARKRNFDFIVKELEQLRF